MKRIAFLIIAIAIVGTSLLAVEAEKKAQAQPSVQPLPAIKSIEVLPAQLTLDNKRDARRVIVVGETENGSKIDLTDHAVLKLDSATAAVAGDKSIRPKAVGKAELLIQAAGKEAKVPVTVKSMDAPAVGFTKDVEPILARVGCNQGTCHGAQAGKEGFKLSLRGYDPEYDYGVLIHELSARRINRVNPDQSLMLAKPAGTVPHEGGKVFDKDSEYYQIIRQWIAEGSKYQDLGARATRIEVLPEKIYLDSPGMSQQLLVIAHYADGSNRDVTKESFISASNIEVAEAKDNKVTALRRGEGAILIRYEGNYATREMICMGDRSGFAWIDTPQFNYIDKHVHEKLKTMKILPSELCTDADFIRRVSLDLTGVPASAEQTRAFLDDPAPSKAKRETLVDALLASEAFVTNWSNKWADLLQVSRENLGQKAVWTTKQWLKDAIAANMPYDQMVRSLLLARGSSYTNPEVNYYRALKEPGKITEDVSQTFLGVRFNCNKCHDHPFERWTQKQYYEFGSYFARVATKKGQLMDEEIVYDNYAGGEVLHPKTNMAVMPHVPFGEAREVTPSDIRRRDAFVEWLASKDNPLFARSYANRVWSYFFGIGIIDPVDDIRASNPASNAPLLDALSADFIQNNFDVRKLMRTIVLSRTYQQSLKTNKWNEDDKINFSHYIPRRLNAEQLIDAVAISTGHQQKFGNLPAGMRSADVPDSTVEGAADVLTLFGKPKRVSACECERTNNFSLSHAINLVNGSTIGDAVSAPDSRIPLLAKREKDNKKVIDELYLSILNRLPAEAEYALIDLGTEEKQRIAAAQDLAWALLNSPAFLYNR